MTKNLNTKVHGVRNSLVSSKKAQGMSTSTIVLLILGLVILVVLILGFTLGWDRLAPWVKQNNIDTVKASCNIACTTGSQYDYCAKLQTVNDGNNKKFDETCYNLAYDPDKKYLDRFYGIAQCSQIDCSSE